MPVLGVIIILLYSHLTLLPFASKKAIVLLVLIITIILPLSSVLFLFLQKSLTGVTISKEKERRYPLIITSGFYLFGYFMLNKYSAPIFLQRYMLAVFVSVLLASVINLKWKISLHMIGFGGILGLLSIIIYMFGLKSNIIVVFAILISGLTGTARLYLKEHSPAQIYTGFFLGFIIVSGLFIF
jgi:hypothetical protein